jgi:hypothetical protein
MSSCFGRFVSVLEHWCMSFGNREALFTEPLVARQHSNEPAIRCKAVAQVSVLQTLSSLYCEPAKLSTRNSHAATPTCSRNQPSSVALGEMGRRVKNAWLQFPPRLPALRAHSHKPKSLPAKSVLIMSSTVPLQMPRSSTVAPNPSIEGMPKRLRLLVTPHVKR